MGRHKTSIKTELSDKTTTLPAKDAALAALGVAIEQKGLDVKILELSGLTDIADYFVIISGTSDRHVQGIAEKIEQSLKEKGERPLRINGMNKGEWVLMDYGNIVVHVFYEPVRQYYEFDDLWRKAKLLELPVELKEQARRLRTGMFG